MYNISILILLIMEHYLQPDYSIEVSVQYQECAYDSCYYPDNQMIFDADFGNYIYWGNIRDYVNSISDLTIVEKNDLINKLKQKI